MGVEVQTQGREAQAGCARGVCATASHSPEAAFLALAAPPQVENLVRELREALRDAGVACASEAALEILHRHAADGEGKLDLAEFGALVTECLP